MESDIAPFAASPSAQTGLSFIIPGAASTHEQRIAKLRKFSPDLHRRVNDLNRPFQTVYLDAWEMACSTSITRVELLERDEVPDPAVRKGHEWPSLQTWGSWNNIWTVNAMVTSGGGTTWHFSDR
jgi:hypothetical protein